jgi:hypothetical protein
MGRMGTKARQELDEALAGDEIGGQEYAYLLAGANEQRSFVCAMLAARRRFIAWAWA